MSPMVGSYGNPVSGCELNVSIEYEVQDTSGCFMSSRTIKTQEDADKMLKDCLPSLLPVICFTIRVNDEAKYKYMLNPEEYAVLLLRQLNHNMLCEVGECIARLQHWIEEEERELYS